MTKDKRKRLVVALNLDHNYRGCLDIICEHENRSPTQQIEFYLKNDIIKWFENHQWVFEQTIDEHPELTEFLEKLESGKAVPTKKRSKHS